MHLDELLGRVRCEGGPQGIDQLVRCHHLVEAHEQHQEHCLDLRGGEYDVHAIALHLQRPQGRTIDVWAWEADWNCYRPRLAQSFDDLAVPSVARELRLGHLICAPMGMS